MSEKMREAARQLLNAWDDQPSYQKPLALYRSIVALEAALAEPEPCQYPDCVDNGLDGKCTRWLLAECERSEDFLRPAQPVQEPLTRQQAGLRRGDILRCVESGVLCTVWATSTSGKALVKWGSDDFGSYTAEQIGELFWVEPRVQEPVAWLDQDINCAYTAAEMDGDSTNGLVPLYTAPPQRPLLTDEEIDALKGEVWGSAGIAPRSASAFARAVERKIRGEK